MVDPNRSRIFDPVEIAVLERVYEAAWAQHCIDRELG